MKGLFSRTCPLVPRRETWFVRRKPAAKVGPDSALTVGPKADPISCSSRPKRQELKFGRSAHLGAERMNERDLRSQIAEVKAGHLSRREFVQGMIAVGLTAPMAGAMLPHSGIAMAADEIPYKPTKAGGGGPLKLLFWQAPTLLNPHFAIGTKDQECCRLFYEPLAGWNKDGVLVPILG